AGKDVICRSKRDSLSAGADPGIDDRDMHGSERKTSPGGVEQKGALQHREGTHPVADVDHGSSGMHSKDGALHRADVGIVEAEVREQCHDAARLHAAMLSAADA